MQVITGDVNKMSFPLVYSPIIRHNIMLHIHCTKVEPATPLPGTNFDPKVTLDTAGFLREEQQEHSIRWLLF
jgi:hypothetical protein